MLSSSKHALNFVKPYNLLVHVALWACCKEWAYIAECPPCAILRGKYLQSLEMVIYGSDFCIFFQCLALNNDSSWTYRTWLLLLSAVCVCVSVCARACVCVSQSVCGCFCAVSSDKGKLRNINSPVFSEEDLFRSIYFLQFYLASDVERFS